MTHDQDLRPQSTNGVIPHKTTSWFIDIHRYDMKTYIGAICALPKPQAGRLPSSKDEWELTWLFKRRLVGHHCHDHQIRATTLQKLKWLRTRHVKAAFDKKVIDMYLSLVNLPFVSHSHALPYTVSGGAGAAHLHIGQKLEIFVMPESGPSLHGSMAKQMKRLHKQILGSAGL